MVTIALALQVEIPTILILWHNFRIETYKKHVISQDYQINFDLLETSAIKLNFDIDKSYQK